MTQGTGRSGSDFDVAGMCAHPDDAELVMGGTLAGEAARGRRVAIVDLTRGESGSRGSAEERAAEATEAARILGVAHRENLALPDGRLEATADQKDVVVAALRRLRPRVVLTQHWKQRHPDHAAASRLVYQAAYLSGLRNYRPDLGPAFRPFKLAYGISMTEATRIRPSFVVDITMHWPTKMQAIEAFSSQFRPATDEPVPLPFEGFRRTVELAARHHGQTIGVPFGEGYVTREPFRVGDLLSLDVSSF